MAGKQALSMGNPPIPWAPAILIIDDEPVAAYALQRFLQRELPSARILIETDPKTALPRALEEGVAVVIVDQGTNGPTGPALLAILRGIRPDVHRILLTGHPASLMGSGEIVAAEPLRVFLKPVATAPFVEFLRELLPTARQPAIVNGRRSASPATADSVGPGQP